MWKIASINNNTHAVTVTSDDGDKLDLTIPDTHRGETLGLSYIKGQTDAHDATKNSPQIITPSSVVVKKFPYVRYLIAVAVIAAITALIIIKV